MNSEFNFDRVISRRDTGSFKWDHAPFRELQPMWVADMDFTSPPALLDALRDYTAHGVFGYALPPPGLNDTVVKRMRDLYAWEIQPDWICWLPGLVFAINVAARAWGDSGDEVLTYTPAYPPYLTAPGYSDRACVRVEMPRSTDGERYVMCPDALAKAITERSRVFLLCHPHNPTGRAFSADEVRAVAAVCLENDVVIVSDEIHCDLILNETQHVPTASLSPEIAARTITLMAPSKTFNVPGLACGFAIISDAQLRRTFRHGARGIMAEVGGFGYAGCHAAYQHGEPWRQALVAYLRRNESTLREFVGTNQNLPGVRMDPVEATYLAWLDCRGVGVNDPAAFFAKAGVGLSDGAQFGAPGFVRLNFGCPHRALLAGLEKMQSAFR